MYLERCDRILFELIFMHSPGRNSGKTRKATVRRAGIQTENRIWVLRNTKQESITLRQCLHHFYGAMWTSEFHKSCYKLIKNLPNV